ncbi:phosphodiesterase [Nonomuraea sp. NN258]|uniref:metallophosphoesterase n=1 Tax=Nonomuraea antri TaxID=2730852 RepID=UPI0015691B4B|nr:metallophosphoesterase [Nonomuraea antri]NRQ33025.1 phosphodiesterase [Nonomuraea antri]
MIVIAHVSDIHLDGTVRAAERTNLVMRYLDRLDHDFDAVLVTGDIADHGRPEEYEEARKLLTSRHPVLVCPGNHDVREHYRQAFLGQEPAPGPINQVHTTDRAIYAICDSSIPGRHDGHLDEETITWLAGVLAASDRPVFIAFHHPPVTLHIPFIDEIRLHRAEPLAELVAGYPNVAAVLVGHAHAAAATTFAGKPLLVAPGIASGLILPWEGDYVADPGFPPSIAFHLYDDEGRLTTHYRVVPRGLPQGR